MLYSEFIEGTQCKDNKHNYKVYKDLEIMYMNSDMSKQDIYEYGKKLVNNEKSLQEIENERFINEKIEELESDIQTWKKQIQTWNEMIDHQVLMLQGETDKEWINRRKCSIKCLKQEIKEYKRYINQDRHKIQAIKQIYNLK